MEDDTLLADFMDEMADDYVPLGAIAHNVRVCAGMVDSPTVRQRTLAIVRRMIGREHAQATTLLPANAMTAFCSGWERRKNSRSGSKKSGVLWGMHPASVISAGSV